MSRFFIFLFFTVFFHGAALASEQILKSFDDKYYYPQNHGLEELIVDLEVSGVLEKLQKSMLFGDLEKVFFRLYWMKDGRRDIEILGMPPGFKEIKNKLKLSMIEKFDFIVPTPLETRFEGYKIKKKNDGHLAVDPSGKKSINSILLFFNAKGYLSRTVNSSSYGTVEKNYVYENKKNLKNKIVLSESRTVIKQGKSKIDIKKEISYKSINGPMLPEEIAIERVQSLPEGESGELKTEKLETRFSFKNYQVNTGEALKWFLKKNK